MLKNIADVILKELGIEDNVPFRVNEWKEKNKDLWIKVTDGVSYWDAGTNKLMWYEDIVLLRQLMDGILTVNNLVETKAFVDFRFTGIAENHNENIAKIKKLIEENYKDVEFILYGYGVQK